MMPQHDEQAITVYSSKLGIVIEDTGDSCKPKIWSIKQE
jgi:hypothetical protein